MPEHVDNYLALYTGITGKPLDRKSLIEQSERVYNFQRVFNLRMGQGVREFDMPPYRAVGPVTKEEYESRAERYDGQLKDIVGVDPAGKTTEEKMKLHREWRMGRYNQLVDAVYKRRGWTPNGVPTMETLKKFGIDFPDVVAVVRPHVD